VRLREALIGELLRGLVIVVPVGWTCSNAQRVRNSPGSALMMLPLVVAVAQFSTVGRN
jgi:hypothetical protein